MSPDKDLSARLDELPTRWANTAPKPHYRGEELLPIVYADPGSNGWYYRERKPDSVTAYVRLDHHTAAVQAAVAKAVEAERARLLRWCRDTMVAVEGCIDLYAEEDSAARIWTDNFAAAIRSRGVAG